MEKNVSSLVSRNMFQKHIFLNIYNCTVQFILVVVNYQFVRHLKDVHTIAHMKANINFSNFHHRKTETMEYNFTFLSAPSSAYQCYTHLKLFLCFYEFSDYIFVYLAPFSPSENQYTGRLEEGVSHFPYLYLLIVEMNSVDQATYQFPAT